MIGKAFVDPVVKALGVWALVATVGCAGLGGFAWWQTEKVGGLKVKVEAAEMSAAKWQAAATDQAVADAAALAAAAKACAVEGDSAFDRGVRWGKAVCEARQ